MAQTPAKLVQSPGDRIDYTPAANVAAGDVVELGSRVYVAPTAIIANDVGALDGVSVFDLPKSTDVFVAGDPVFWDGGGSPVTGTASSGAATNAVGTFAGMAIANAANTASYVRTKLGARPPDQGEFHILAGAGGNIATAAQLEPGWTKVTGADNSVGVILPACKNGVHCVVVNQNTDKTLKVYPPVGKQINGAGANNAIVIAVNSATVFRSEGANAYYGYTANLDLA